MKVASFEKLKYDWNQTWFIDRIWDPLYVHAKVIHQSQRSSEVKLLDGLKM